MYKTCGRCGGIHQVNKTCYKNRRKQYTNTNRFRNTQAWIKKAKEIKERDKYLCQVCLTNKYKTTQQYTYQKLEVHHITPLDEDWEQRLYNDNLITLCPFHHHNAEDRTIPRVELQEIVKRKTETEK